MKSKRYKAIIACLSVCCTIFVGCGMNWSGIIHDVRVAAYSKSSIH